MWKRVSDAPTSPVGANDVTMCVQKRMANEGKIAIMDKNNQQL